MSRWIALILAFALPASSLGQTAAFKERGAITEEDLPPEPELPAETELPPERKPAAKAAESEIVDYWEGNSDFGPDFAENQFELWVSHNRINRKARVEEFLDRIGYLSGQALRVRCALSLPPHEICLPRTSRKPDVFDLFPSARERVQLFRCSLNPRPADLRTCDKLLETTAEKHSEDEFRGLFAYPLGLVDTQRYESIVRTIELGDRIPGQVIVREDTTRDEQLQLEVIRQNHDIAAWKTDILRYVGPSAGAIGGAGFAQWKAAKVTSELTRRVAVGELVQVGGFVFNPHTDLAIVRGDEEATYLARTIERALGKSGTKADVRNIINQFLATPNKAFSIGQADLIPKFSASKADVAFLPTLHEQIKEFLADQMIDRPELFARVRTATTDAGILAAKHRMLAARLDQTTILTEGTLSGSVRNAISKTRAWVENGGRRMTLWIPERLEPALLSFQRAKRALGGGTTLALVTLLPILAYAAAEYYWYKKPQNIPTFVSVAPPNQKVFTNDSTYSEVASLDPTWIVEMAHQFAVDLSQEGMLERCVASPEGCDMVYGIPSHIVAKVLIPSDPLEDR